MCYARGMHPCILLAFISNQLSRTLPLLASPRQYAAGVHAAVLRVLLRPPRDRRVPPVQRCRPRGRGVRAPFAELQAVLSCFKFESHLFLPIFFMADFCYKTR
jgi:hypothetical protein